MMGVNVDEIASLMKSGQLNKQQMSKIDPKIYEIMTLFKDLADLKKKMK
jgi:aspartyl/asparaginyl-tRNA synthetase